MQRLMNCVLSRRTASAARMSDSESSSALKLCFTKEYFVPSFANIKPILTAYFACLYYAVNYYNKIILALQVSFGIPILHRMNEGTQHTKKPPGRKKSFNLESDVESLFGRWKEKNPMIIESRIINAALRQWFTAELTNNKRRAA